MTWKIWYRKKKKENTSSNSHLVAILTHFTISSKHEIYILALCINYHKQSPVNPTVQIPVKMSE